MTTDYNNIALLSDSCPRDYNNNGHKIQHDKIVCDSHYISVLIKAIAFK